MNVEFTMEQSKPDPLTEYEDFFDGSDFLVEDR